MRKQSAARAKRVGFSKQKSTVKALKKNRKSALVQKSKSKVTISLKAEALKVAAPKKVTPKVKKTVIVVPLPVKGAESNPEPATASITPSAAPTTPTRAPTRKIFGLPVNNKNFERRPDPISDPTTSSESQSTNVEAPRTPELQVIAVNRAPDPSKPWPVCAWDCVPSVFPVTQRAIASLAKSECDRAVKWPMSFARLMVKLQEKLNGTDFALLLMDADHPRERVLQYLDSPYGDVTQRIEAAHEQLRQVLFEQCPDMYRYWSNVLGGSGVEESALIERYLVEGIDRSFQVLMGRLLLLAFGARHPSAGGKVDETRWTSNPNCVEPEAQVG